VADPAIHFRPDLANRECEMSDLKIRVYKGGADNPATTVTIPGTILRIASNLVPKRAVAALQDEGIDLAELVRLSESSEVRGTLVEVDGHEKNERVVISLE